MAGTSGFFSFFQSYGFILDFIAQVLSSCPNSHNYLGKSRGVPMYKRDFFDFFKFDVDPLELPLVPKREKR